MTEAEKLRREISELPVADRLRLAAHFLEANRPRLAHAIAEHVVLELGAALTILDSEGKP